MVTTDKQACPNCGGTNIRQAIGPDWKDWPVCRDCGWGMKALRHARYVEHRGWSRANRKD